MEILISEKSLWRVLLHLPVKSLMRFKCVSKRWYAIIRNPKFALEHRSIGGGSRYLLIEDYPRLSYANLNENPPRLMKHNVTVEGQKWTPVVEGIMGRYDFETNNFTLFNLTTHELLTLSPPPVPPAFDYVYYTYSFGYDPANQVFKVLCLCTYPIEPHQERNLNMGMDAQLTYVLTLGGGGGAMNWRTIAPAPFCLCRVDNYVCTNGVMYWVLWKQESLVAFNLNKETFETFATPQDAPYDYHDNCSLGEIGGRPALVDVYYHCESMDVWTMNEHCRELWTKRSVLFPKSTEPVYPIPTEKVMLVHHQNIKKVMLGYHQNILLFDRGICVVYMIFYDHRKDLIIVPIISGGGDSEEDNWCKHKEMYYYEENIICLDELMNN